MNNTINTTKLNALNRAHVVINVSGQQESSENEGIPEAPRKSRPFGTLLFSHSAKDDGTISVAAKSPRDGSGTAS